MPRFPKTVNICGKTYSVKTDKSRWGGRVQTGSQQIVVGTSRDQSAQRIFTTYIHEVIEAVTLERKLRYESSDDEIMFVMTHKQFDNSVKDVATAILPKS